MSIDWARAHAYFSKFPFSLLLAGFSVVYGLCVKARSGAYHHGVLRRQQLPGFVLSVGNITVGGTGKTPAVIMLARWAKKLGYFPCVLSRGYGGKYREEVLEVSNGREIRSTWQKCGDEPYLLANKLLALGIPVIVSKKRYLGGRYAVEKFGSELFILDDGFQHLGIKRDFDLLLLDSRTPFGSGRLIPWGTLREPPRAVRRADAIILTRWKEGSEGDVAIKRYSSGIPIFSAEHRAEKIVMPQEGGEMRPSALTGQRVAAFAGIANPDSFRATLEELGAKVCFFKSFGDHHLYTSQDLIELEKAGYEHGARYILTTEKDWVKLQGMGSKNKMFGYLAVKFEIIGARKRLFSLIERKLEQLTG
ncbi:MAG: tetraacyldisaccharide 4'-kinase [Deltaproteobacteria bacterium]|nr:MAG: tetraacyldisaccharide 4'-kinase [Deltaproteobacteria bacterium]